MDKKTLAEKSRLLVKYGFMKKEYLQEYAGRTAEEMEAILKKKSSSDIIKMADMEYAEIAKGEKIPTNFPKPLGRHRIVFESVKDNIEESYYWQLYSLRTDLSFTDFYKIIDVFSASPNSSFWGNVEQRIGLQQDKAAQFLRGVSEMTKALFQIVRELRIIDERLSYYKDIYEGNKNALSSEITLKGIYVDQVEGGSKNPASVYGLANSVGFTLLPDLFFRTSVKNKEDIDETVDKQPFNEKLKEVLKRKLRQYYEWQEKTYKELKQRRKFTLAYLRQHFDTINLYISWIVPYLRNIERLRQDHSRYDSVDLVSAFESSLIEIEFLAAKPSGSIKPCIDVHFLFRSKPQMSFMDQHSYQRGPLHVGKLEMNIRAYAWTDQQIENYRKMREEENMLMLQTIDKSLREAMHALGDELFKYLREAEEEDLIPKEEKKEEKKKEKVSRKISEAMSPFTSIFGGFKELFLEPFGLGNLFNMKFSDLFKSNKDIIKTIKDYDKAVGAAHGALWLTFKNYKKAHKMITW